MDDLQTLFSQLEQKYNLPEGLMRALAMHESRGDPRAVSGANAKGLFQINPITQKHLKLKDPFDPVQNTEAAGKYLGELQRRFGPDLETILAAWNWGPGNVRKYGTKNLPFESRRLFQDVRSNLPQKPLPSYMSSTGAGEFGAEPQRMTAGKAQMSQSPDLLSLLKGLL